MDANFPKGMIESISDFLTTKHRYLKKGQDIYQQVFDHSLMFPLQRQRELTRMIQIARSIQPKTVFEIGSDKAGGLYHWCQCIDTVENVIACEIRGVPYSAAFEEAFPDLDFLWLGASSYEMGVVHAVQRWLGQGGRCTKPSLPKGGGGLKKRSHIDVLFIDGDKSYFDRDFDCYLPLMNPKGIVFMHDITDSVPREAYEKVIARGYRHEEIIDKQDYHDSDSRRMEGIPARTPHEQWLRHWKGTSCGVGVIYLDSILPKRG